MAEKKQRLNFDLPTDSVTEILSRLPAKSVLRFKSVCKAWYTMIKNPSFIKKHEKNSSVITSILAINICEMFFLEDGYSNAFGFESLSMSSGSCFGLLGTCHGLVCLHLSRQYTVFTYIIGNPTTRDFRRVPSPTLLNVGEDRLYSGFCSSLNDYKLVRVVYHVSLSGEVIIRAELYTLSTDAWVEIDVKMRHFKNSDPLDCYWSYDMLPVFQNGVFYWKGCSYNEPRVVSFDISEGFYDEINIPANILDELKLATGRLYVHENSWRLVEFEQEISLVIHIEDCTFKVWALDANKNSWTCKLRVDSIPIVGRPFDDVGYRIVVVGYTSNGELLIEDRSATKLKLLLYDLNSRETEIVPCADVPMGNRFYIYTESLDSVKASSEGYFDETSSALVDDSVIESWTKPLHNVVM